MLFLLSLSLLVLLPLELTLFFSLSSFLIITPLLSVPLFSPTYLPHKWACFMCFCMFAACTRIPVFLKLQIRNYAKLQTRICTTKVEIQTFTSHCKSYPSFSCTHQQDFLSLLFSWTKQRKEIHGNMQRAIQRLFKSINQIDLNKLFVSLQSPRAGTLVYGWFIQLNMQENCTSLCTVWKAAE